MPLSPGMSPWPLGRSRSIGDLAPRLSGRPEVVAVLVDHLVLGDPRQPGAPLHLACPLKLPDVLADAQYSELRFARLVRSDADRLADELPTLARFLAAKGTAVDWAGAAQLILSADGPNEESVRRHVARDYYGSLARAESR